MIPSVFKQTKHAKLNNKTTQIVHEFGILRVQLRLTALRRSGLAPAITSAPLP